MRKTFLLCFVPAFALVGFALWRAGFPAREPVKGERGQRIPENSNAPRALASQSHVQPSATAGATNAPAPVPQIMVGTNFGYSNGVYFQTVVTQVVVPQPPPDPNVRRRYIEAARERNARLGIDQDIAQREADLKEKAKLLAVGMTPEQVVDVMGKPEVISGVFFEGTNWVGKIIQLDDLPKYTHKIKYFGFDYTPYPVEDFLRRERTTALLPPKLYENLSVLFSENQQVKYFYWR